MPFVIPEDVGTTPRGSLSPKRRLQAWERTHGTCVICESRIDGVRERWIVEHIRALELGGADELDNLGPAHERCARVKTRDDHARTARAKRQKIRHLGAGVGKPAFASARSSLLKRKVDGTVVLRGPITHRPAPAGFEPPRLAGSFKTPPAPEDERGDRADSLCTQEQPSAKQSLPREAPSMTTNATDSALGRLRSVRRGPRMTDTNTPRLPPHLATLLAERPHALGADSDRYEALLQSFVQQIEPVDVIEAIWVKDIVDLIWEARQARGWRGHILQRARLSAVTEMIQAALDDNDPMHLDDMGQYRVAPLASGWLTGQEPAHSEVNSLLNDRGLTAESVTAHAFLLNLAEIERIERLIANAEHRRDTLLREIERKRARLASRLRGASIEVIDATAD